MKYRIRAALIHLTLSAGIAVAVFLPIYFFWYPDVLFSKAGGRDLFFLILSVDVTLGPLITFVIFVPRKKGLVFDLAVIAVLQTTALAYGVYVLFESRPVYVVFVKDRFELVRANQIPPAELSRARGTPYESLPLAGPVRVGARIPEDKDEKLRIMMSAFAGMDLHMFPQHYVAYEQVRAEVRRAALPIEKLRLRNRGRDAEIDAVLASLGRKDNEARFLPMRAGKADLAVFVDPGTADVLKISGLNPWGQD